MIPKIIHYCWFGKNPIPKEYETYISTWKALHPDWEIKQWNETNAPIADTYLQNALQLSNWSNCSNYIRLWALKEFGGIYLDTDFNLIKPLDVFLVHDCFLGFEQEAAKDSDFIVNNAIVGAVKNHPFIEHCYNELNQSFNGNEKSDLSGPLLTTRVLKSNFGLTEYGFQTLANITIYPTTYFYPIHVHKAYLINNYTEHIYPETYGIHMWGRSWVEKKDLLEIIDYLNYKTHNQENYIKELKESIASEQKKSDEIWYWKNHFEEQYNELVQQEASTHIVDHKLEVLNKRLSETNQLIKEKQEAENTHIVTANKQLQQIIEHNNLLKNELQALLQVNQKLNDNLLSAQKDKEQLQQQINESITNTIHLQNHIDTLAQEIKLLPSNSTLIAYEHKITDLQHQLSVLEEQYKPQLAINEKLELRINEQCCEILKWVKKEESWRSDLAAKTMVITQLKNQLTEKSKALEEAYKELENVKVLMNNVQKEYHTLSTTHGKENIKDFFSRRYFKKN